MAQIASSLRYERDGFRPIDVQARLYRRLLILATIGPILVAIVAYKFGVETSWPWTVAVPLAATAYVLRDLARTEPPYRRLWTVLAVLPSVLWVLFLIGWVIGEIAES